MTRRARDKRARDISTIDSAKLNVAPPPFPRFNEASNPLSAPLSMEQKPPSFQNRGGYFQSEPLPFSLLSSPFWSVHASNGLFRKSYELDTWTKASSPRRKGGRFNRSFPLARKSVYYWRWFIATPIYFDQNILLEISLCNNEYIYMRVSRVW